MNRPELWVLAAVAWWTTATLSVCVLYGVWVAATSNPTALLLSALILPLPVFAGVAASGLAREARLAPRASDREEES